MGGKEREGVGGWKERRVEGNKMGRCSSCISLAIIKFLDIRQLMGESDLFQLSISGYSSLL